MTKRTVVSLAGEAPSGTPTVILPSRIGGKARSLTPASPFDKGANVRKQTQANTNASVTDARSIREAPALVRYLAESNGLVSTAITNMLALSACNWKVTAYETWTQEFSREGLLAAETIISALDTSWDYGKGYVDRRGISLLVATGLFEVLQTGGCGLELVLDKLKVPKNLVLFPYDSVIWKSNGEGGRYPAQRIQGAQEVELNFPTVFIAEAILSTDKNYARPMMAAGAQRLFQYESYIEDMWRVVRKAGEPRIVVKLDYEKVANSAPAAVRSDPVQFSQYLDQVRDEIEAVLRGLEPEEALVLYDLAEVDSLAANGEKKDFKELLSELSGLAASALQSNPSMLGMRLGGSQNVASTESMLSTKVARIVQVPVEEVFSRALTLAVRLYGVDAYVKFEFSPINLRPDEELEAHKAMRHNRVLELLSLGRITDDEAQVMLDLGSLPNGAEQLSGTMFYSPKAPDTAPASGTNARNQAIAPQGTSSAGGKDKEPRP
jgi:hypothetical protein